MRDFSNKPIMRFLSSMKLAGILLVVFAFGSGLATFIEVKFGRVGAQALVYNAVWFEIVIALLVVNLICRLLVRFPFPPRKIGFFLVHVACIVILISAAITRYFGYEGIMPIREGEQVDYMYSARQYIQAHLGDEQAEFPVRLYKPGQQVSGKSIELCGERYRLSVADYWPHYTESYEEGEGGVPAVEFGVSGGDGVVHQMLLSGRRMSVHDVSMRFAEGELPTVESSSRYGELRVRAGEEICTLVITPPPGDPQTCGGYTFEITDFQSDFRVGQQSDPEGPLRNPMVEVTITSSTGEQDVQKLFAFYPEFSMGHANDGEGFTDLELLYEVAREVVLARDPSSGADEVSIIGRAPFPLQVVNMEGQTVQQIAPGEQFAVQTRMIYKNEESNFTIVPVRLLNSAVKAPALSTNPDDRAAAQIVLTDQDGNAASAVVLKDGPGLEVTLNDQQFRLAYGSVVIDLPYSMHLDDFVLETYPGSDNPASYESHVRVFDDELNVDGLPARIYMNHPLTHRGSKHFQSSYDPDRKGTVLTVNHDPGKWPTYIGYILISIGFILVFFKDLIWPKKSSPQSGAGSTAAGKAAALALLGLALCLAPQSGMAQQEQAETLEGVAATEASTQEATEPEDETVPVAPPPPPDLVLSDPARAEIATMIVQDYRGRMKPLDTLCREMSMKITKKSSFEGREPIDMYFDWVANPEKWWNHPLLSVKFPGLHDLLGIDHSVKHIAASSLYDDNGSYRLQQVIEQAHRTPDRERTKLQRKLILFDERFNLLFLTLQGKSLRIYPVPDDENNTWSDIHEIGQQLSETQFSEYQLAFLAFFDGLKSGDSSAVTRGAQAIKALQAKYGAAVLPSDRALKSELWLNSAQPFLRVIMPYFLAAILFLITYTRSLIKRSTTQRSFREPLYVVSFLVLIGAFIGHTYGYVLRWIASGRAPLSNGHESLLFISLMVALAGLVFELIDRRGSAAGLASFLAAGVLGVSLMATFDPAIGPLVPVLASFWLNIHVTIITGSYGFLGLSFLIGMLMLILYLAKGPNRDHIREAIDRLYKLNHLLLKVGIGLLAIGTLLGGVWANESWGRYWGWDAKETWSLVTILVYAVVLHFKWIPGFRGPWPQAAGSFASIASIVMTYFGVNYFLSGLHSYAAGDVARVPNWVYIMAACMVGLIVLSRMVRDQRSWD